MILFTLGFPDLPDIVPVLQVRSLACAVGPKMCPAFARMVLRPLMPVLL